MSDSLAELEEEDFSQKSFVDGSVSSVDSEISGTRFRFKVEGIHREASALDLGEYFGKFGNLVHVDLIHDKMKNKSSICYLLYIGYPKKLFEGESAANATKFMDQDIKIHSVEADETESPGTDQDSIVSGISSIDGSSRSISGTFIIDSIDIGSLIEPRLLYCPRSIKYQPAIRLNFSTDTRTFKAIIQTDDCKYKIEFGFGDVDSIMVESSDPVALSKLQGDFSVRNQADISEIDLGTTRCWLLMVLKCSPKLFRGKHGMVEQHGMSEWRREMKTIWHRIRSFENIDIDFENHRTFRLEMYSSPRNLKLLISRYRLFQGLISRKSRMFDEKSRTMLQNIQLPIDIIKKLPHTYEDPDLHPRISFDIKYSLRCLISNNLLSLFSITPDFLDLLSDKDPDEVEYVLNMLIQKNHQIFYPEQDFERMEKEIPDFATRKKTNAPNHCVSIRKIIVTPTRLVYVPPTIELGNRVLRHFEAYQHRFLRIAFAEESLSKYLDGFKFADDITERIRITLKKGIKIAGRYYEFLAFSSSQLREHSCWFFAPTRQNDDDDDALEENISADSIRKWMGDFSDIKVVAKYAARLGQCFSSTMPVEMPENSYKIIPDIERNGFVFSDGVGKISPKIAAIISKAMQLSEVPSAFQFRMGGFKGVLAVDPAMKPNEPPLQLRKSQRKFVAGHNSSLDIIRTSTYSPAFLNHQIITLLSSMTIKDRVFVKLQSAMQKDLEDMMNDVNIAGEVIKPYIMDNECYSVVYRMLKAGILPEKELFLYNQLHLFQCGKLKDVKQKARIHVPKGVQLIGVLDETGTLQYGEMFVQFTDPSDQEGQTKTVVKGMVLMAKMPAVHPGDLRVLKCVDYPELRHYCNVAVFPQNGPRPHPNEASGSDLDGDIYFVTWDKSLIPPIKNFRPFDHDDAVKPEVKEHVKIEDVADFMVDYIGNDNLGRIAVAHKIHADLSLKGAHSDKCLHLAKLHTIAVDFPKTGIPAQFDVEEFNVKAFPDFMGRKDRPSYESKKALGKLYRAARWKSFNPEYSRQLDLVFLVPDFEKLVTEVFWLKQKYDEEISHLMNQYGIRSEFECISAQVIEYSKWTSKKEFELRKAIGDVMRNIILTFRNAFWQDIGVKSDDKKVEFNKHIPRNSTLAMQKAAAAYYVSYAYQAAPGKSHLRKKKPFISFAWLIAGDILIQIYNKRQNGFLKPFIGVPRVNWDEVEQQAKHMNRDIWKKTDGTESFEQPKVRYNYRGNNRNKTKEPPKKSFNLPDLVADGTLDELLMESLDDEPAVLATGEMVNPNSNNNNSNAVKNQLKAAKSHRKSSVKSPVAETNSEKVSESLLKSFEVLEIEDSDDE